MHNQVVKIKTIAESEKRENVEAVTREEPLIENYFCQESEDRIIKITRIIFSDEIITLTDIVIVTPIKHDQRTLKQDSFSGTDSSAQEPSSGEASTRLHLPAAVKDMLRRFRSWIEEHRPELADLLQSLQEGCQHERELKEKVSRSRDLREAFVHFAGRAIKAEPPKKGCRQALERWLRAFRPLEEEYRRSGNFVDDMLVLGGTGAQLEAM